VFHCILLSVLVNILNGNIPFYHKGKMYFSMCAKYIFNLCVPQKYFSIQQKQAVIVPMHKICNNMSVKDHKPMSLSKFWACYAWPGVSLCQVSIDSHYCYKNFWYLPHFSSALWCSRRSVLVSSLFNIFLSVTPVMLLSISNTFYLLLISKFCKL
jgi:hypothetical protein